ncbi:hypothetical protein [Frigoriflavimonas asaccharolytica]|uniref:Uncharacterized protein n=1 Tax=Frigoriflavimonas asaccharolytica TaxID=2735899 RepID=A0A8J8KAB6_9FLAO|nr:hypothetical protein [Frigoriflavimonas asaccharolytica]NRS91309.1 hypothetical protein [Frigoriflavimonas asaccharolytica]
MAILFLIIGILSLGISAYFFTKKPEIAPLEISAQKQKGDNFENYMIQRLAKQDEIQLVGKVSDYYQNGITALENYEPDLKFKYKNKPFAVECKWRNAFKNGKTDWAKNRQIQNYLNYQNTKKEKVYVALGIGGKPEAPERLYLIPLYRLTLEFVTEDYIQEFVINDDAEMLKILNKN